MKKLNIKLPKRLNISDEQVALLYTALTGLARGLKKVAGQMGEALRQRDESDEMFKAVKRAYKRYKKSGRINKSHTK